MNDEDDDIEYQIEYSIQRKRSEDDDFEEVGFGSSGAYDTLDTAAHMVITGIQRREWETTGTMPDPASVGTEGHR